jgi:hypothetical protein
VAQQVQGELSDADLVMRAALGDREGRRSGKGSRALAVMVMVLAAAASWLVLVLGKVPDVGYVGAGLGIVVAVTAALFLLGVAAVSPLVAWGSPARGRCPGCGQRTLREDRAIHSDTAAPGSQMVTGIVTLCDAGDCEHAAVRKVRRWPAG